MAKKWFQYPDAYVEVLKHFAGMHTNIPDYEIKMSKTEAQTMVRDFNRFRRALQAAQDDAKAEALAAIATDITVSTRSQDGRDWAFRAALSPHTRIGRTQHDPDQLALETSITSSTLADLDEWSKE